MDAVVVEQEVTPRALLDGLLADMSGKPGFADTAIIERAYDVATQAHEGQKRRSGEPYLIHPVRVAHTIAGLGLDATCVAAGLLHDSIEDSELTVFDITESVGREVATLVDGVTKLGKVPYLSRQEQQAESFRKMLLAMSQDVRVLILKLCDRLDNMRTLEHMPRDKRERISRETMEIYAPLAHQLGIRWVRSELENLSFRYLEPAIFNTLSERVATLLAQEPGCLEAGIAELSAAFGQAEEHDGVSWDPEVFGEVTVRASVRTPFELHRNVTHELEDLADVIQFEIITRDRGACYYALGVLHGRFKPVPGVFRDHIALPRPNRYQALHTTLVNHAGHRRRVHVRSRAMDEVAARGIIAESQATGAGWAQPRWLGMVMDWQEEISDPHEFIAAVKADLFADEVYVFTPGGDIHTFRKGATPIDFAFAIHTDVGRQCSGARVNGQLVPLRYQLHQGDTVEILTSPNAKPRQEWLQMCRSAKARARIKYYLRQEERARLRGVGRSLIEQELGARGANLADLEADGTIAAKVESFQLGRDLKGVEGLYEATGAGVVTVGAVADAVAPPEPEVPEEPDPGSSNLFARVFRRMTGAKPTPRPVKIEETSASAGLDTRRKEGTPEAPIRITRERLEDLSGGSVIQLAGCCSPVPGDPLIGYFAPNKGIIAHVETCPEGLDRVGERRVFLAWDPDLALEGAVTIEVRTTNTVGLLAEMSRVFSHHGVNIKQANCRTFDHGQRAINTFHGSVGSRDQLESLMATLSEIDGVIGVRRVFGRKGGSGSYSIV
ncbi:MAG: bifunctional (p)ppGpp synthetase/guanosine-3',5'-bis(diphosphate) 3'-pyrophosphohydrolase [Myxococcales bacterium]|nr:bifunctional (p)ppGpp synthetase/guanosine-3',5'-bis(diphosphate) 3'-pyrophosphohydrolase [Myxococcales bacterium]